MNIDLYAITDVKHFQNSGRVGQLFGGRETWIN